ncbi:GerMN domain-containing protein [Paramaledivibacter caminithermalis]|uniref:Sporulation and spore germination n=1 Tax=Paramaledivibacter caminithermalis (strain DSM 15212 / CIP 107654 / DViRD3) TaxID=1121301 RepID=A0A1M6PXM5_PARC5|nr:GerMN domain-containing protein [Paramaledivibacter caminithermalis]SHK12745.1 Sporulation and spore germination [Paramaledivibacter caminithermalis DSM 15212]
MKRIVSCLLIGVLILGMLSACKKKDEAEEVSLEQTPLENQAEEVEANNDFNAEEELPEEVEYILYLRYKDKPFLYDEYFTVNINDDNFKDKSIEEFVIQQLMDYKKEGEFITPVPEGTKLLSIKREGKNVIVNLSKEFKEKKMSTTDAKLTTGGIINSLVALPGNETVQIMVEGEILENFNGVKLSEPLYFIEGLFPDK